MSLLKKIKKYFRSEEKPKEIKVEIPATTQEVLTKPVDVSEVTIDTIIASDSSYFAIPLSNFYGQNWKFFVKTEDYLKFKVQPHRDPKIENFIYFVTYNHPKIKEIANHLIKHAKGDPATIILDFVHSLVIYNVSIEKDSDYVRYPLETLVERNGDCEDFCILAAALMKSIGIDVALIYLPKGDNKSAHMALGIRGDYSGTYYNSNGKKYFFVEATGPEWLKGPSHWKIGQMPEKYKKLKANIYVVP